MGVRRVIALGTCIEYEMTGGVLSEETTPLVPASKYARSKDGLRQWLDQAAGKAGYSHGWGRIFYPYGPGENSARLCSSAIRQIRSGAPWVIQNPNSVKDYIFIEDLAAAILVLAASDTCGAINLGTGAGVSIVEIARTIADLLGRPELVREARSPAPDPFGFVVADVRRLQALGWQPRVTLVEGLRKLIQHHPAP
jgi:dTDP-6-deoxy-L-talose 4-dehydrogenase (NAD+)